MPTRKQVDDFVNPVPGLAPEHSNNGWTFDPELGWVLKDSVRFDGLDGSRTFYHYEPTGARRRLQFPDSPCRIHTYGDSFTHCDQVSDGETWQEYLAAHLGEPIENYGVGGYSVYQAFLRMRRVETARPADYVILNVWCDDSFRNLDSWRTIRFGRRAACGFPLPHLRVDPDAGLCEEVPDPTPTVDDVYKLLDPDWVCDTFAEDPILRCILAGQSREVSAEDIPVAFGVPHAVMMGDHQAYEAARAVARAALYSTRRVIEMAEELVLGRGRKLMVVLSHSHGILWQALEGRPYWDRALVDYLAAKPYPVLDLRDAHLADFRCFNLSAEAYLKRFLIGHYSPAGNFFTAMALKSALVDWLHPRAPAYA